MSQKSISSYILPTGKRTPFTLAFVTDGDEVTTDAGIDAMGTTNELEWAPGGIIGFSLDYSQVECA